MESTQEENEVIKLLCSKPGFPKIMLSDSDSEPIPPSPKRSRTSPHLSKLRLKLGKKVGECVGEVE